MSERRGRIHEKHDLSKTRRCELLDVPRSSAYYRGESVSEADLAVMRLIDEIHLQWPFYGSRRMRDELEERGHTVNRKRVQRLMRQMDLRALYPRRRTSQPGKGHKIYPYLLRDLSIERANQAWASDISYIPMAKGFMSLVAIMDWYSRRVLSWRVSNTLDTDFCIEALEDALQRFEAPEIFNTDQGSQFTSDAFTDVLKDHANSESLQPDLFDEPTILSEALAIYMPNGFAMHTADLIEGERSLVEHALDEDKLAVVFATTTLAQGLNYSFKTVIFDAWSRYNFPRRQYEPIRRSDFHNIAGRAGRLGKMNLITTQAKRNLSSRSGIGGVLSAT